MNDSVSITTPKAMPQDQDQPGQKRTCGTCFACCVHSGIEAAKTPDRIPLRSFAGQSCHHLDGTDPSRRCSVYSRRPIACERFQCAWLQGLGTAVDRPDQSGVMVSIYPDPDGDPLVPHNATVTVIDGSKCGEMDDPLRPLRRWIDALTTLLNLRDIRVVNHKTRQVLHLLNGLIYLGQLHKAQSPEDLIFDHAHNNGLPIGKFSVSVSVDENEKEPLQ